jgi:hypothetical protein
MKYLLALTTIMYVLIFSGCSKDDSGSGTDPFGPAGQTTGSVTFTVALVQNGQNQKYFQFKPSAEVIVQRIAAKCQALNIDEAIEDADITDDVFSSTVPLYVGPITLNLVQGQKWTFTISGKIGSKQGSAYSSIVDYTVQ